MMPRASSGSMALRRRFGAGVHAEIGARRRAACRASRRRATPSSRRVIDGRIALAMTAVGSTL